MIASVEVQCRSSTTSTGEEMASVTMYGEAKVRFIVHVGLPPRE
jgi:hypothetical protein